MRQSVDSEGTPRTDHILSDATGDGGSTLLSEMSKYLDLSEVVTYIEHMSSEESEDLWMELDGLTTHKLAA